MTDGPGNLTYIRPAVNAVIPIDVAAELHGLVGVDESSLTADDLALLDHFHAGSKTMTTKAPNEVRFGNFGVSGIKSIVYFNGQERIIT